MPIARSRKGGKARRLGKLEPQYKFWLNPYQDVRFSVCLKCGGETRQRKLPLVIHIDPRNLIALNKTCRYCPYCDLLVVHQDELESVLAQFFAATNPEVIGNDYLVLGTLEKPAWRRGLAAPSSLQETVENMHDFKQVMQFKVTGGWTRVSNESDSSATRRDKKRASA